LKGLHGLLAHAQKPVLSNIVEKSINFCTQQILQHKFFAKFQSFFRCPPSPPGKFSADALSPMIFSTFYFFGFSTFHLPFHTTHLNILYQVYMSKIQVDFWRADVA